MTPNNNRFVVPADDMAPARPITFRIIFDAFKSLKPANQQSSDDYRRELLSIRRQLSKQSKGGKCAR